MNEIDDEIGYALDYFASLGDDVAITLPPVAEDLDLEESRFRKLLRIRGSGEPRAKGRHRK